MAWNERVRPETDASEKRSAGKGVFRKCDGCGETLLAEALARTFEVCPTCGHHHRLGRDGWRKLLLDDGSFSEWDSHLEPADPLQFSDGRSYRERVASAQRATGAREAIEIGRATLSGIPIA